LFGNDNNLGNAHVMRFAGRFARRVRHAAQQQGIPVLEKTPDDRMHEIAAQYRPADPERKGVFCITVHRAPNSVWGVTEERPDPLGQSLRLSHSGSRLGAHHHQGLSASPVPRTGRPEWSRVRSSPGNRAGDFLYQRWQLFYGFVQPREPGEDRRDLALGERCRAFDSGL